MLDARFNEWWSRLPANGPWLVSALFVVLIAVEAARIAITLLGGGPTATLGAAVPLAPAPPPVDAQYIAAAHLFGIARLDSGAQNPADAPPTTANLTLAGTIATQDPKHGLAIIVAGGPSKVYSVSDAVGGASLYGVYPDRVVLDRGGVLETLKMPQRLPAGQGTLPYPMRNTATVRTLNNLRQMVQTNPGILNTVLRAVPSYDTQAGRLRGFRIYPGINRRAFAGLGLQPGDLVTAIDGTPLDDPQRGRAIFDTIESSDQAVVTVERNGQTLTLTLNIAQVAAQAGRELAPPAGRLPRPYAPPNLNE